MKINKSISFSLTLVSTFVICVLFWGTALAQAPTAGTVNQGANLRAGPGTSYAVIGGAPQGQSVDIVESNAAGTWLQLSSGEWIAAFLVDVAGSVDEEAAEAEPLASAPPAGATQSTATSDSASAAPNATALRNANVRAGPGVNHAVVDGVRAGQALAVQGQNAAGSWLQLSNGNWIAAFLVNQTGSTPPAATSSPAAAPPTDAAPAPAPAPTAVSPAPTASPEPPEPAGNRYVATQKRLLGPVENGGSLDGPSVHCGHGRALKVNVVDANGVRINGVPVQAVYGAKEVIVTGAQGRGDGVAEFVLGDGQAVTVLRNADGSPAESETIYNLSTDPRKIPWETLQVSGYCQDEESCQRFAESFSCIGHYSWEVTFERR